LKETKGDEDRESLTPPLNAAIIAVLLKAEEKEKKLAIKVLWLQTIVALIATGITAHFCNKSQQVAIAVMCGGGVSILNGAMLAWRMAQNVLFTNHNSHQQLRLLYFYAIERFLIVVMMLGICLKAIKLSPLAVLSGFVLGQTVLLIARLILKIKIEK
jgi:hypothetical protein